jgi:hypothetical protein
METETIRVKIVSSVQVAFPTPGEPELNVIAQVLPGMTSTKTVIEGFVSVVVSGRIEMLPTVGSEVEVTIYENFYRVNPGCGIPKVTRLCLRKFPQ